MSTDEYNIDDILLEAQRLKSNSSQGDFPLSESEIKKIDSDLENALNLANSLKKEQVVAAPPTPVAPKRARPKKPVVRPKTFSVKLEEDPTSLEPSVEIEKFSVEDFAPKQTGAPEPVPKPVAPLAPPNRSKPKRTKPKRGQDERVDLFEFQPEKRDLPMKAGPFGQKYFNFNKTKPQPEPPTEDTDSFDFDSISNQIDQLQSTPEDSSSAPVKSDNPFETQFSGKGKAAPPSSKPNLGAKPATPEEIDALNATGNLINSKATEGRKSIFSTFATGTGRELNIEDIKKIDFSSLEGAGGYYDDEDDEDHFTQELPDGSYLEFNEFLPKTDRRDVAKEIAGNKFSIFVRTAITTAVTIILFYIAFSAKNINLGLPLFMHPTRSSSLPAFILVQTVLCGLLLAVCWNTTISGIGSLFKMRANSDTLVTFSLIGAVIQGAILYRNVLEIDAAKVNLLFPIAALGLLFNYIGKLGVLSRIQRNFKITAAKREKRGVTSIESPSYCKELLPNISQSQPTVAFTSKADFFADFLSLSFSTKYDVGINRAVAPVSIIGAVIVGFVTQLLSGNVVTAITAFAAVLCICSTLSTTFVENIPLGKMSKTLTPMGAMVSGNKAVEHFCDTSAVVLTETELFPKGHVYLNGIKAFPNQRIDDAILDASSVLCALNGSLGYLFLDMIGGNEKLLKKVDNVVYENNMGLSGWVDGRRVLIGNRMLMQNHGIKLPNDSYEKAHPKDTPGNPIYVSNSGEVSARFLVAYTVVEELAYQLDRFAALEKELIIYTTDANITAQKIWEIYGYPVDLITIMSSELQDGFREMSDDRAEMPAEIVCAGGPASFLAAILAAINTRSAILTGTIIQLIQIILGYSMVALMSFMGYLENFTTLHIVGFQLLWFVIIFVIQQVKKP